MKQAFHTWTWALVIPAATLAEQTLDIGNSASVMAAYKAALPVLQTYFNGQTQGVSNNEATGAWLESYGSHQVVQWYESGEMWELFYSYYGFTGDSQYAGFVDSNIQLALSSYNGQMGFLDAESAISGRWNDDIGWWGLAMMTAAEGSPSGIVNPANIQDGSNPTYLSVANATYTQILEDWDSTCGGGIYWARDRNAPKANDRNYKSTITNTQHIHLAARLFAMTKDPQYQQMVDQVYAWVKSNLVNPSNYMVADGLDVGQNCAVDWTPRSYAPGQLIAGLSVMYKATQNHTYLDEAHKYMQSSIVLFSNASMPNVLYEASCAGQPVSSACKSPPGFMWSMYRGLGDLYAVTDSQSVQSQIKTTMQATASQVISTCDSNWSCMRQLDPSTQYTLIDGTNIRDQIEVVALLNGLSIMGGATTAQRTQDAAVFQVTGGPSNGQTNSNKGSGSGQTSSTTSSPSSSTAQTNNTILYAGIGGGVAALLLFGGLGFCYVNAKKRKAEATATSGKSQEIYYDAQRQREDARSPPNGMKNYPSQPSPVQSREYSRSHPGEYQRSPHPSQGRAYGYPPQGYQQQQQYGGEYGYNQRSQGDYRQQPYPGHEEYAQQQQYRY